MADWTAEQIKEHVEAILARDQRATEIAEREREKAAQALADSLARSIEEGDERLREHIETQVRQIEAALDSAERLETERFAATDARTKAVQREIEIAHEAAQKAIAKAEIAAEKRFDAVNEFRAQLSDQAATFLSRELYDAQHEDLRKKVEDLADRLNLATGGQRVTERRENRTQPWQVWAAGAVVTLVVALIVVVANVLTTT